MTAKLSTEGSSKVRKSLESLPAYIFTQNDSKQIIVDTGASVTASGDKSDFLPETFTPLSEPIPLDGIGGSLEATHRGICRFEVITDDGSIAVMNIEAVYAKDLGATLLSPQEYFSHRPSPDF